MTLSADVYFSYRSPYSYLAAAQYVQMVQDYELIINLRVVWPIAVRDPGFFERENPQWLSYLRKDIVRVAEYSGQPLAMPNPDPIIQNMETREIAAEQPLIGRVSHLGLVAQRRGGGLAFAQAVSTMVWGGTANWNSEENLAKAAAQAGFALVDLQAEVDADTPGIEAEIEANQNALEAAGHWGVPTLVFEGEPFFGQDRVDLAIWRMRQQGLSKRKVCSLLCVSGPRSAQSVYVEAAGCRSFRARVRDGATDKGMGPEYAG